MLHHSTPPPNGSRAKRTWCALGAAALTLPLLAIPAVASAADPAPQDPITAIGSGDYLPDFQQEFIGLVDPDRIWEHDVELAGTIGPRPPGSLEELAAADYVQRTLDSFGFETERDHFTMGRVQTYANVVPSRTTEDYGSWQFKPAGNARFTGPDAPVSGEVIDLGAATSAAGHDVAGKIVLVNWLSAAGSRNALLTELGEAGAAGVVFAGLRSETFERDMAASVPEEAIDMVVVGTALNQTTRIRTLLEAGTLSLDITTQKGSLESTNVIGVRPAANGDADAPIVYIGAHIDSVVGSPGASDNGSGASIMLELARIFSEYSLDTEIRVGGWGAEEAGILGSMHHVDEVMTADERARTLGAWNMDMAGTAHPGTPEKPFGFWALTVDGATADENVVLGYANEVSNLTGRGDLQIGQVGRSDHQYFHDAGIPAAVFSWMYWNGGTDIILEPAYHQTTDTLELVSAERMGIAAEVLGGSAFRAALNEVSVSVTDTEGEPAAGATVAMSCGADEGWREGGTTDEAGKLLIRAPHTTCDFVALSEDGRALAGGTEIAGDTEVSFALVEDLAPEIVLGVEPGVPASGWYTTAPVTVSIESSDDFDIAPTTEYSLDGGATWTGYAEPFALSDDGQTTVNARATDDAGLTTEASETVRIDTVKPVLALTRDSAKRGNVAVEASDVTSGVDRIEYRLGGSGGWTVLEGVTPASAVSAKAELALGAAATTAEFRVFDVAGNVSDTASVSFAAATSGDGLANTGSDLHASMLAALGALALIAVGGGALVVRSRSRLAARD